MKRKLIALLMCLTVSLGLVACGTKTEEPIAEDVVVFEPDVDITIENEAGQIQEDSESNNINMSADTTVQSRLVTGFVSRINQPFDNLEQVAVDVCSIAETPFEVATMPVPADAEYFAGFGETTITGYKDCVQFGPMIGTIPFIGYIFELEDESEIMPLRQLLESNYDLRWNICTAAETITFANVDNYLLVAMHTMMFDNGEQVEEAVDTMEVAGEVHNCSDTYSVLDESYVDDDGKLHSSGICDECGSILSFIDGELIEE